LEPVLQRATWHSFCNKTTGPHVFSQNKSAPDQNKTLIVH
jgi:hypothetical protein